MTDGEVGVTNHLCPSKHERSKAPPFCSHGAIAGSTATTCVVCVQSWAATLRSHKLKTAERNAWLSCTAKLRGVPEAYKGVTATLSSALSSSCKQPDQMLPLQWQKQTEVAFRSLRLNFLVSLLLLVTYHRYCYLFLSIKKKRK